LGRVIQPHFLPATMSDPTPPPNTTNTRPRARSRSRGPTPPPPPRNLPRCAQCAIEFGFFFNRQHHCRNCGQSVCSACSESELPVLEYDFEDPVRVCDMCKNDVLRRNAELLASSSDEDEQALPAPTHAGTKPQQRELVRARIPVSVRVCVCSCPKLMTCNPCCLLLFSV
jgi:hypothetical protein